MKCDELKPLLYSIRDLAYVDEPQPEPHFQNPHDHAVYKATEVDAAIDELKTEHHKERDEYIEMVHQKDKEIAELKQKLETVNELIKTARQMLEDAKATAYAESVDAGMRERRLKRELWLARANRALEKIAWFKLWNASISTMNPEDGARQEFDKWKKNLGKLLAKAETYV